MLESLKKLEGSGLEAYCIQRMTYFDCASRCTNNQLVLQMSRSYDAIVDSFRYCKSIGDVKKELENQLHPTIDGTTLLNVFGQGVVVRDVLHFINEGIPMLPHDLFDALSYIEANKLRDLIWAERTPELTRAQMRAKSEEKRRQMAEEEERQRIEQEKKALAEWKRLKGLRPVDPDVVDKLFDAEMERLRLMKEGKVNPA